MNRQILKAALILGLISVIGPFAIDMYLPTLPEISRSLHADTASVQLSIMAFMLATALFSLAWRSAIRRS